LSALRALIFNLIGTDAPLRDATIEQNGRIISESLTRNGYPVNFALDDDDIPF
jgi:hypothetical protein